MANAKSRLNAPKSAANKKKVGKTKSLAGRKEAAKNNNNNEAIIRRLTDNVTVLSTDDKVQLLLENGPQLKDKFVLKTVPKLPKKPLPPSPKVIAEVKTQPSVRDRLITKSGRIVKKSKSDLKLMDNILKSELLIELNGDKNKKNKNNPNDKNTSSNNNNDMEITNQNDADLGASGTNSEDATNTTKNVQNGKDPTKPKQLTLSNGVVLTVSEHECDICHKMFSSKSSIRRHMYIHLGLKPYTCPLCQKKFCHYLNMKKHMKKLHASLVEESHICHICDKIFKTKEDLGVHISCHINNDIVYKCIYCAKQFSHQLLLSTHEKEHLINGRYHCTLCPMTYECRNRLTNHVRSHLNIKDYICQFCGKDFLRLNSMRRHVQISHVGHRIQCPICKKNLRGHLTEHMRTHEKRRPHECPECGACFTQSTQLNVHRRSHTGDRPYHCRICDRRFSHSNALMLHIRRHTGEKPFPCAVCPLAFSQLPHMKAHMRKIHKRENPYKCLKCNEFFKLKAHIENHDKVCKVGVKELSFEEKIQASVQADEVEVEPPMPLPRMRFLLALLFTMIASKEKLKYLGAYPCIL
ncbi:hypothetical protein O3G_MSEX009061 [Manduca sexta]|uniref:C2H2-type domain-containing protein n=1 Tax=Manduca sexta TaxID=7130 RepID=A0A921ZC24_MANSE|nr:hypothetical protein O3G_MSEX009061 [Manduca sexta]